jgi:hypothetical protein
VQPPSRILRCSDIGSWPLPQHRYLVFAVTAAMSVRLASFATLLAAALGQMIKSTVGDGIDVSIAIPNVDEGPFDILVKIDAPTGTGWASVAWGGGMLRNPLSVAWANAGGVVVSSRLATYVVLINLLLCSWLDVSG